MTSRPLQMSLRGIGHTDVICGGFPCQAFSVAGKRAGFNDTRGTLFFEIMRFASILRPRYLFLENVEGLLNHNNGDTFETILRTLDEVGYDAEWNVLNSKNFGVPQNRARVFIIGHLRGASTRKIFPLESKNGGVITVIGRLEGSFRSNAEVYDINGISPCLNTAQGGDRQPKIIVAGNVNPSGRGMNGQVFHSEGISPTLTTNKGEGIKIIEPMAVLTPDREEKRQNGRRIKEPGEPMFTLTAQDRHGIYDGHRVRKLTPREYWRLQGFPDEAFDKARAAGISDSQLYKQAGNSVTVNVIEEIAKSL
ncbi:modification methylase HhaI [Brevibacillus laterosporus LMG 15441]|uniref:Cytosine-specific methyltransferase n=2 Tax=Brevibacillus laterosporus TaxID=1465 RepID=A0A075R6I3_BRELA|nr:modification methylase HhaI [Brevibacillus laterosporus LMG 15441]